MNKRKPDDEFARINMSFFRADGTEVVVYCPESKNAPATQTPSRRSLETGNGRKPPAVSVETVLKTQPVTPSAEQAEPAAEPERQPTPQLKQKHFIIRYDDTGYSYEKILGEYLPGVRKVTVEDPYVRALHQVANFVRLCELLVHQGTVREVELATSYEDEAQQAETAEKLADLTESLKDADIKLQVTFNPRLHDRSIKLDNGWVIKIGRGLDIYQKPQSWFEIGASDLNLRRCLETNVDIFHIG